MSRHEERARGLADAQLARADLYDTLGQLRQRLDYAQRIDDASERLIASVEEQRRERPGVFAVGALAVSALAGTAVWAIVRGIAKRFE